MPPPPPPSLAPTPSPLSLLRTTALPLRASRRRGGRVHRPLVGHPRLLHAALPAEPRVRARALSRRAARPAGHRDARARGQRREGRADRGPAAPPPRGRALQGHLGGRARAPPVLYTCTPCHVHPPMGAAHVQDHGPDPPADRTWASQWNLDGEVSRWADAWGRPPMAAPTHAPTAAEVADAIFAEPPIEWNRFSDFQVPPARHTNPNPNRSSHPHPHPRPRPHPHPRPTRAASPASRT